MDCLHSLQGGGATDVTPAEDQVKFNLLWIAVGVVALLVLVAVLTTICVCGVLCGKRQGKYIIDAGMQCITFEGRREEVGGGSMGT